MKAHIPALDGIRGIAIALVMAVHFLADFTPTNGFERAIQFVAGRGTLGVDLFFVLSGFLITGILLASKERDQAYFKNFFMRRVLRIFPLYYGVLALVFFGARWIPAFQGEAMDQMLANQWWAWGYMVNFLVAKAGSWTPPFLSHCWSLAVEEHFYLVWPFVVFYLSRRGLIVASIITIIASTALCLALELQGVSKLAIYVLTPCRLNGLCLGALLAALGRDAMPSLRAAWLLLIASLAAKALIFAVASLSPDIDALLDTFRGVTWLLMFVSLIIGAVQASQSSPLVRLLTSKPFTFLGKYSYGLYIFHHFISSGSHAVGGLAWFTGLLGSQTPAILVHAAVAVGISIAIAYLSYHGYEKHFLKLKDHFTPRPPTTQQPAAWGITARARSGSPEDFPA